MIEIENEYIWSKEKKKKSKSMAGFYGISYYFFIQYVCEMRSNMTKHLMDTKTRTQFLMPDTLYKYPTQRCAQCSVLVLSFHK